MTLSRTSTGLSTSFWTLSVSNRILLVTGNFPPQIGGPATFIEALARYLVARGEEVTVLCSSDEPVDDSHRPYRVVRVSMRNRYLFEVQVRSALAVEFIRHKRILVNTLDNYLDVITRIVRRPFIAKVVGDSAWERGRNLGIVTVGIDDFQSAQDLPSHLRSIQATRLRYLLRAGQIVTPGAYLADLVAKWGIDRSRVSVIPNAAPPFDFTPLRPLPPAAAAPLRVTFVGRFTNWKGIETILLAAARTPDVEVTLCGDGPLLPTVVALISQLGLTERVQLVGKLTRQKVVEVMGTSHTLVLPSLYEGLSHTLLEGLDLGLPIIASDIGGNREIIGHDREGLLIPPFNVAAMVEAFNAIRRDWRRYSQASLERAQSFSFERCASSYHELLCA